MFKNLKSPGIVLSESDCGEFRPNIYKVVFTKLPNVSSMDTTTVMERLEFVISTTKIPGFGWSDDWFIEVIAGSTYLHDFFSDWGSLYSEEPGEAEIQLFTGDALNIYKKYILKGLRVKGVSAINLSWSDDQTPTFKVGFSFESIDVEYTAPYTRD